MSNKRSAAAVDATAPVRRRVTAPDGVRLAVYEWGGPEQGPTVVLVHGYPDTHAVWRPVAELLAADHHVVAYDVRGAGASDAPRAVAAYALDRLEADLGAVLAAVSPDRGVHLVGHDWGSIQSWESVTGEALRGRIASFTSVSGPCLDHAGRWMRAGLRRPTPRALAHVLRQQLHSWYIGWFQLPVLPPLLWRAGLARAWPSLLRAAEGVSAEPAPTLAADAARGIRLYRANMRARLARPRERRTAIPVQLVVAQRDLYVTPALAAEAPRPWTERLWQRELPSGHWAPLSHPGVLARWIAEFAAHAEGAPAVPELARSVVRAPRERTGRPAFADRLVVVTGAGSGIGRATALAFAEAGAVVVAADLDEATAAKTAELASRRGPRAHAHQVDVADAEAMAAFAAKVLAEHGTPDVVVNNAGVGYAGSFLDHTAEDWSRVLGVNLSGVAHGCRLFGAAMKERGEGGHLVNIASAAAFLPSRTLPAYAATKAGVLMLSECLRAELAADGIGVSAVCPGFTNTPIARTTRYAGTTPAEQERRAESAARAYRRRNLPPERVAAAVLRAVREDRPVLPVGAEAWAGAALRRLSPGLLRRVARVDLTPRQPR